MLFNYFLVLKAIDDWVRKYFKDKYRVQTIY